MHLIFKDSLDDPNIKLTIDVLFSLCENTGRSPMEIREIIRKRIVLGSTTLQT
jgi:hypothetical protein